MNSILSELIRRSTKYYNFNERAYHNVIHRDYVLNAMLNEMAPACVDVSDSAILAAAWHDAVYYPGAGSDANERASAAALKQEYMSLQVQEHDELIHRAMRLIEQTSIQVHLTHDIISDHALAVLLDADLRSLAAPYDQFIENQKNIVVENYGSWPEDKQRVADFLKLFDRQYIYHTDYGREHWEASARQNIRSLQLECK